MLDASISPVAAPPPVLISTQGYARAVAGASGASFGWRSLPLGTPSMPTPA
jgi:hypothetical protein